MAVFEVKSKAERNKLIAAIALGILAIGSLYLAFGGSLFGSSKPTVTASQAPKPSVTPKRELEEVKMPLQDEQDLVYQSTAVVYNPLSHGSPDPGRNIFAFYEPPPPCPECPKPTPKLTPVVPPTPSPTPPILIAFVTPQSVYAGARGFKLEISGDKFTPDARIYFSQTELPTTFVSPQRIAADVSAALIASEGPRTILVQTLDGKAYSNQVIISIQSPPRPQFQYIGMIARKRYNNDTAYLMEQGKQIPISARLNDVIGGRFRLVSISSLETVFEDVNLGFRHRLPIFSPPPGTTSSTNAPGRGGFQGSDTFVPYNPPQPVTAIPATSIPGIPDNIPRYVPPANTNTNRPLKKDVDDEDDEDGDN